MTALNEKQVKLFTDRNWGVIATIREDGSPPATPVWIDYDGENVLVNSALGVDQGQEHRARPPSDRHCSTGRGSAVRLRDGERHRHDRGGGCA